MEVLSFFLRSPPHLLTSPHLTTPQHTIEACPLGPMEACPLGPMQACPLRAMEACPLGPKEAGRWVLWRRVRCVLNSMHTKQLPNLGGPTVCNSETSRHLVRDPTSRTTPPTTTLRPYSHPKDRKTFKHSRRLAQVELGWDGFRMMLVREPPRVGGSSSLKVGAKRTKRTRWWTLRKKRERGAARC